MDRERMEKLIDVGLHVWQPGGGFAGCSPKAPVAISGLQGSWCEDRFDQQGETTSYKADGRRRWVKILVPLRQPDVPVTEDVEAIDRTHDQLFIDIHAPSDRYEKEHDLLWRIVNSIYLY